MVDHVAKCDDGNTDVIRSLPPDPLISVITPVLNGIAYLEECVRSILDQSYTHTEQIFIDGGSTDGTLEILAAFAEEYPDRIHYISEPDKGPDEEGWGTVHAWNKGLKMAGGDILGWLGSDDTYEPDALLTVVEFLRRDPDACFVYGACNVIDEKGEFVMVPPIKDFDLNEAINENCYIPCTSAFFRREVYDRVGTMDTMVSELDYWIRIGKVFSVHRIDKVLSNFRIHDESYTGSKGERKFSAIRDMYLIGRRHGGGLFSGYSRSYYRSLIVEILRRAAGPMFPHLRQIRNIQREKSW